MSPARLCLGLLLCAACSQGTVIRVGTPPGAERTPPTFPTREEAPAAAAPLPDSSGWGTHVLAVAQAPEGAVWVGTYGQGIYVSRDGSGRAWENLRSRDSTSISWDFVNAIAFAPGEVWYGTIGNGWGVSRDGGRTWRNWTFDQLGPRWQYVAPEGIATAGDTVYIATADGLRITHDRGETYRDVTATEGLTSPYLIGLAVEDAAAGRPPRIRVRHLRGVSESSDGGRTWGLAKEASGGDWQEPFGAADRAPSDGRATGAPLLARIESQRRAFRTYANPGGATAEPGDLEHFWFRRPIDASDNPHLDQTYTYGSTMGGNFQQHQGVELNNPAGTPVHAIGDGIVIFAGTAEAGANAVAIRHDRRLASSHVFSTYYHNADLTVRAGQRVRAGDVIGHVGSTGRATNDHLHLEIRTLPTPDSAAVDMVFRYPRGTRNPQLWIAPLPGTGAIAGTVRDARGRRVRGARVYGVTKPLPRETPFSFAETYEDRAHPDPVFGEDFAIGDVPAGEYVLGVEIEGVRVFRKVRVDPGRVTQVEFRPPGVGTAGDAGPS
ncbi:MAG: M23 family metallopeptidase [Gemmatimonadetes bacterium]|nr:M23 family metallopeptidase [Gemmatimonadota bacterium]